MGVTPLYKNQKAALDTNPDEPEALKSDVWRTNFFSDQYPTMSPEQNDKKATLTTKNNNG